MARRRDSLRCGMVLLAVLLVVVAGNIPVFAQPACHVRFWSSTPGGQVAAQRCGAVWEAEGREFTSRLLPAGAAADTVTCLVLDSTEFSRRFAGSVPDWGVGVALGPQLIALDYVRIPAVGRGLREVFLHEMAHALLTQGTPDIWLPAWFHEGVALQVSGEWRFWDMVSLALEGRVPDLSRLQSRWPTLDVSATRAYGTSLLAVRRLQAQHGDGIIRAIVTETSRTGSFAAGFAEATGESDQAFSADFGSAMRLKFGWVTLLSRWPGLFVLMALGFAVGAVRKIALTRRRLAEMDEEESSHPE